VVSELAIRCRPTLKTDSIPRFSLLGIMCLCA